MNFRKIIGFLAFAALIAGPVAAQNRTTFGGEYNAAAYAYGITGSPGPLYVQTGNSATGSSSITVQIAYTTLGDGTKLFPLGVVGNTFTIGTGANSTLESPTITGQSNCGFDAGYATCTVTASFTYTHGTGEPITSATFGLQEAINAAHGSGFNVRSGGVAVTDAGWGGIGGLTSTITSATAFSNVPIKDTRAGLQYWSMQPTTLTSMAVPATLAASTVVFAAAPVGTWANSAYYFCVTYVDALGGEGPCSLTYNQTPTVNYSVTITAPVASTGAVGWRFYAGASYNAAYLMPIDPTHCVLTVLENVMPACAMGANGGWIAPPVTTTSLRPNATVTTGALASPTVNISATQPQAHTTFGYQPSGWNPQIFQTHYGPFPAYGSTTSGQVDTLGSINLPAGFLNVIGRTVKLRGKVSLGTVNTAALPTITVLLSWAGGTTAGVGVTTCSFEGVAAGATKTYNGQFECQLNTNAVGATAVGTVMPGGYLLLQAQDISAAGLGPYVDTNTAAVGSLGLFAQNTVNVVYTSNTNTTTAPVMLGLDVEVNQ